jgi:hypothetical protein
MGIQSFSHGPHENFVKSAKNELDIIIIGNESLNDINNDNGVR